MVGRLLLLSVFLAGVLWPQPEKTLQKSKTPEQAKPTVQEQEPPEEDEGLKPKEYTFNPLEAEKDLKVGTFYFKKGNYKGAVNRFREATQWNPGYAEAYLRLGESEEKMKNAKAAREAYAKYLELAPESKEAAALKKKLSSQR
jgi:tetratricopeptide (TPR) repeat protein